MKENELRVIQNSLRTTRDCINLIAPHEGPFDLISDEQLRRMHYDINDMVIAISHMIEELPW